MPLHVRKYAFIGPIYSMKPDGKGGFIRPSSIYRADGKKIGITIDDDVYVHIEAFNLMVSQGYEKPAKLHISMLVAFFIGPSGIEDGRVTAEACTVVGTKRNR